MTRVKTGQPPQLTYIGLLIIQGLIFGFSFIAMKNLLNANCPPFLLLAIRFTLGAVSLLAITTVINRKQTLAFTLSELKRGGVAGGLLFLAFATQTVGQSLTTPGKCSLLTGMYVVFVPVIASIMKRRVQVKPIALSVICFIGIGIVSGVSSDNLSINLGDAMTVLCGVLFAAHIIALERFTKDGTANLPRLTVIQLAMVAVLSACVTPFLEAGRHTGVDWAATVPWFAFVALLSSAVAYFIQTVVQSKLSAHTVAVLSCMEVVFALAFSLLLAYDEPSLRLLSGGAIILGTMVYTSLAGEST